MSGAVPGRSAAHASGAPDAGEYVATSGLVDPSIWSERSAGALAAAADRGMLVAGRERLLAATGVAATLPLPHGLEDAHALAAVRTWLAAVARAPSGADAPAGRAPGPIALGAFPFDRGAPAMLVVPSVTWCCEADGRTWRVEVRRRDATGTPHAMADPPCPACAADRSRRAEDGATGPVPGRRAAVAALEAVRIRQVPSPGDYAGAVARAVADIRGGRLTKVVLARMVEVLLPAPPVPSRLLDALWGGDRIFSPFSVPTPGGRLVGASPELLISRRGRTVTSHAFAGTVPRSEHDAERLFASEKDRAEHRLVVEEIVSALERRCAALNVPAEPTVVRLRSDARLGTLIRGTLARHPAHDGNDSGDNDNGDTDNGDTDSGDGDTADTALELLARLHPTPAVGGVARAAALERISALEPAPRGYWAGAVGWTDCSGDGEWVLGIRSVEMHGRHALVWAGAGVVAESDPAAELAETTVKLRPVLDALWPGAAAHL